MRLIDAEKIEEFASRYTEFDGKPLTRREKDLADNVCKKISTQMPAAYDLDRVVEQLEEMQSCAVKSIELNSQGYDIVSEKEALNRHYGEILAVVKGGGADGQSTADSF